jgi:hypothetical protein
VVDEMKTKEFKQTQWGLITLLGVCNLVGGALISEFKTGLAFILIGLVLSVFGTFKSAVWEMKDEETNQ